MATTSTTTTSVVLALPILTTTKDAAKTLDLNLAFSNDGHDATLNNTGNIGLRTNDTTGLTTVSGGNVDMNANGNVIATNGFTGIIYGDVTGTATGTAFTLDLKTSDTSKTVATSQPHHAASRSRRSKTSPPRTSTPRRRRPAARRR